MEESLDRGSTFAEFSTGVFGDEGGVGEEVEGLAWILHLGDEFIGLEHIGGAFFD